MITEIPISSLDHPDLTPYRTLRQSEEQYREGLFIAEGEKVVRRLLDSTLIIQSVLITPEWLAEYRGRLADRPERIAVFVGQKDLLDTIVGFNLHQGIMALGRIPALLSVEQIVRQAEAPYLFAAIDGLTNAENLGVLVRNCAAFGVQAVLAGETSSSPYLRRSVRNSMGTVFKIPVVHCTNLVETITALREENGFKILAAHPHTAQTIYDADFCGNCCLVFGSEGNGVSAKVLAVCDTSIAIPMHRGVDSLNVASASAVFLYEAVRQRETGRRA